MMPLKAGEDTEEGMIPRPILVRLIRVFFAEEEDLEDGGGANPDTPPLVEYETTAKSATKDVLSFILFWRRI